MVIRGTDREEGTTKSYFKAFKDNFKQATPLWLIIFLCMASALINPLVFYLLRGPVHYLFLLFALLSVLAIFIFSYAFPLLSQFDNTNKQTFKNALAFSIAYFPRSILVSAINVFPFVLMLTNFYVFLQMGFLWAIFYFAIAAYLNSRLLYKVFAVYMTQDEEESSEVQDNDPEEDS